MDRQTLIDELEDPQVVAGCLVTLYAMQEPSEQASRSTHVQNGAGFNALDAGFGSSLAEQAIGGRLSAKQVGAARKMLHKYMTQISRVVDESPRQGIEVVTPGAKPRIIDSDLEEIAL